VFIERAACLNIPRHPLRKRASGGGALASAWFKMHSRDTFSRRIFISICRTRIGVLSSPLSGVEATAHLRESTWMGRKYGHEPVRVHVQEPRFARLVTQCEDDARIFFARHCDVRPSPLLGTVRMSRPTARTAPRNTPRRPLHESSAANLNRLTAEGEEAHLAAARQPYRPRQNNVEELALLPLVFGF
jgi:hypothetical protein